MSFLFPEVKDKISEIFPEVFAKAKTDYPQIISMRHSTTDIDDQDRSHGWINAPLNSKGTTEAIDLASKLKDHKLDALFSSDLDRAKQSALFTGAKLGATPIPMSELRPMNMGNYAGKTNDEIRTGLKGLHELWSTNPEIPIPGGESWKSFHDRNYNFLVNLFNHLDNGTQVGIMGHSATMKFIQQLSKDGIKPVEGDAIKHIVNETKLPKADIYEYKDGKLNKKGSIQ